MRVERLGSFSADEAFPRNPTEAGLSGVRRTSHLALGAQGHVVRRRGRRSISPLGRNLLQLLAISGHFRPFPAIFGRQLNEIPQHVVSAFMCIALSAANVEGNMAKSPKADLLQVGLIETEATSCFPRPPLAYAIEEVPARTGITRTKIYDAIKKKKLTARKAGRSTIIEHPELVRYIKTLPTKGREPGLEPAGLVP
jgi:hypothetical protein